MTARIDSHATDELRRLPLAWRGRKQRVLSRTAENVAVIARAFFGSSLTVSEFRVRVVGPLPWRSAHDARWTHNDTAAFVSWMAARWGFGPAEITADNGVRLAARKSSVAR